MKKKTIDSVARVTEEVALDVIGGIAGLIGEYLVPPTYMGVIKYEFLWKHPNASKEAKELRVRQEFEILLAKLRRNGYVEIRDVEPRRIYYHAHWAFKFYLMDLLERMHDNGATKDELESISEMIEKFSNRWRTTITTNNLRWIHKMENKYGVEEET